MKPIKEMTGAELAAEIGDLIILAVDQHLRKSYRLFAKEHRAPKAQRQRARPRKAAPQASA